MAFTGVAVIEKVSDRKFRITGLSLAGDEDGTIGLVQNVAVDVPITAPEWNRYETSGLHGGVIGLDVSVEVTVHPMPDALQILKIGNGPTDFLIEFSNTTEADPFDLDEIYVEFH